ncbi:uncharacterized protein DS421_14g460360 [Arachis hypogaea]|nr:uncharacterized protein DS421_14g460360 [Arachis hypogaea]
MLEAAVSIALVSATARSRRPHRVVPPSSNRCSAVSALFHRATALLCSSSATLHPPLIQFHCAPPSSAPVPRRSTLRGSSSAEVQAGFSSSAAVQATSSPVLPRPALRAPPPLCSRRIVDQVLDSVMLLFCCL